MAMDRNRPRTTTLSRLDPGALIREARGYAGLTQAELATRLGTTQSVVSRWERGADIPRVDTLGRILQGCGFEVDLRFRRHDDVDRSQIDYQLHLAARARADYFDSGIRAYDEARRATKVGSAA
jgi:transcriptional regulator with XRE-family HTH domain